MKNYLIVLLFLPFVTFGKDLSSKVNQQNFTPQAQKIGFEENKGQVIGDNHASVPKVKYYLQLSNNAAVFFLDDRISLVRYFFDESHQNLDETALHVKQKNLANVASKKSTCERIDLVFEGANTSNIVPSGALKQLKSYSTGIVNSSSVHTYTELLYKNVYEGVDLKFFVSKGNLKYDFIVHNANQMQKIKIKIDGASSVEVVDKYRVKIGSEHGSFEQYIPVSYLQNGKKVDVSSYLDSNKHINFKLHTTTNNSDLPNVGDAIVIDPLLIDWGCYTGSTSHDLVRDITIDNTTNNFYTVGYTYALFSYPSVAGIQPTSVLNRDAFIARYDVNGALTHYHILGGAANNLNFEANDDFRDVIVDPINNDVYVVGVSNSSTILNAPSGPSNNGGYDVIIASFNSTNLTLQWHDFYGGTGDEDSWRFCLSVPSNTFYVIGSSTSSTLNGTSSGVIQPTNSGGLDMFVASFSGATGAVIAATFIGGSADDMGIDIKLTSTNDLVCAGRTDGAISFIGTRSGTDFDGVLMTINSSLTSFIQGIYHGNSSYSEHMMAIEINTTDEVFVAGIAVYGGTGTAVPPHGAFLSKFGSALNLIYKKFLAPNDYEDAIGICLDNTQTYIYMTGLTTNTNLPHGNQPATSLISQPERVINSQTEGTRDGFIAKFKASDGLLLSSNLIGSAYTVSSNPDDHELVYGIAFNSNNQMLVSGNVRGALTNNNNNNLMMNASFPYAGLTDTYVMRFCETTDNPQGIEGPISICTPSSVSYKVKDASASLNYVWILPTGVSIVFQNLNSSEVNLSFSSSFSSTGGEIQVYAVDPLNTCGPSGVATLWIENYHANQPLCDVIPEFSALRITPEGPKCININVPEVLSVHSSCTSNPGTNYNYTQFQWYFNGNPIPNATQGTYSTQIPGFYKLESYDGCGNAVFSQEIKLRDDNLSNYDNSYATGGSFPAGVTILNAASIGKDGFIFGGIITIPSGADVTIDASNVSNNCTVIIVEGKLTITHSDMFSCYTPPPNSWSGIELVVQNSGLPGNYAELVVNESIISDAISGISVGDGVVDVQNSTFSNNIVDIGFSQFITPSVYTESKIKNNNFLQLSAHPNSTHVCLSWPTQSCMIHPTMIDVIWGGVYCGYAAHIVVYEKPIFYRTPNVDNDLIIENNKFYGKTFPLQSFYVNCLGQSMISGVNVYNTFHDNGVYFVGNTFSNSTLLNNRINNSLIGVAVQNTAQFSTGNIFISHNLFLQNQAGVVISPDNLPFYSATSQTSLLNKPIQMECNKLYDCNVGIMGSGPINVQGTNLGGGQMREWENMFVCKEWELIWENFSGGGSPITVWHGSPTTSACNSLNSTTIRAPYILNGVSFPSPFAPYADIFEYLDDPNATSSCRSTWFNKPIAKEDDAKVESGVDLTLYPNPTENKFFIALSAAVEGESELIIHDIAGKEMLNHKHLKITSSEFMEVDLGDLQKGVYVITVRLANGKVFNEKIIKM